MSCDMFDPATNTPRWKPLLCYMTFNTSVSPPATPPFWRLTGGGCRWNDRRRPELTSAARDERHRRQKRRVNKYNVS